MAYLSRLILLSLLGAAFTGCTGTPYQPRKDDQPVGYRTHKVAEDRFWVTFSGNPRSSPNRVHDFALLRAAELAKEHGFAHFAVEINRNASTARMGDDQITTSRPGVSDSTRNSIPSTPIANRTPVGGASPTIVEVQVSSHSVATPVFSLLIRFLRDSNDAKPAEQIHLADEVIAKLRAKYGLKP